MATFNAKANELINTNVTDEFLTATASEVLQAMPITDLIRYASETEVADANGFDSQNKRILGVLRAGYTAQEVELGLQNQVVDSGSIHFSATRSPVYYYDGGNIFAKPDPTADEKAVIKFIAEPTVEGTDSSIAGFPDTAEYAVVLGACVKQLTKEIDSAMLEEDVEIAQGLKMQLDTLQGLYQAELQRLGGIQ